MPNVSNDLSQKLYATMEKHKEVRPTKTLPEWLSKGRLQILKCINTTYSTTEVGQVILISQWQNYSLDTR